MLQPTRRAAIKTIGAASAALTIPFAVAKACTRPAKTVRIGIIADLHGGLAKDSADRLDSFLKTMKTKKCDALIQLGDFAFPNTKHQVFADKFNAAHDKTVHVIGNHEFDFGLTREDCYEASGIDASYYRVDVEGLRLIVLDGNETGSPTYKGGYRSYIGTKQMEWLEAELKATDKPVVILSHQPLAGVAAVDNFDEIQQLLSRFKQKIIICLNGHTHVDSLLQINGVSYLHINSASYYWVGGDARMAYYKEPLFTTVSIDLEKSLVAVGGVATDWKAPSPADIGYFERDNVPPETIVTPQIRQRVLSTNTGEFSTRSIASNSNLQNSLKVMTWNIWGRLNQEPRYTVNGMTARERTIQIIKESGADIVAMIETYGSAAEIAGELNFEHHTTAADANLCIFSRYPISDVEPLSGLSSFSFIAATVKLPTGQKIRIYDVWLTSGGRHIVEIKNKELSDRDFCSGDDLRYDMLKKFLEHTDFKKHLANKNQVPIIAAGDFNCVSHLDHYESTRQSKLNHSRILNTKVSKAMHQAGFIDAYRETNPDIVTSTLGHTWTTVGLGYEYAKDKGFVPVEKNTKPEYRNPYTRIDYIYSAGKSLLPINAQVISHHPSEPTRSFPEFPSDHAAVVAEFQIRADS